MLIFRPRLVTELRIRAAAERQLRTEFDPGKYYDQHEINSILMRNEVVRPRAFATAMITLYPTMATCFIEDLL